jgi:regulatory protein
MASAPEADSVSNGMKVTAIKQQLKMTKRYSVYVDEQYSFSLTESSLIESGLHSGTLLTRQALDGYKKLSLDDKMYSRALKYVAMRQRTAWEVSFYLERKGTDPTLLPQILNKLSVLGLIDDEKYARAYINDRLLLRPTSRRKIIMELKKKRIAEDIVQRILAEKTEQEGGNSDVAALAAIITRKRRQTKYQDDLKLMQYLARQGFSYGDIKAALSQDEDY